MQNQSQEVTLLNGQTVVWKDEKGVQYEVLFLETYAFSQFFGFFEMIFEILARWDSNWVNGTQFNFSFRNALTGKSFEGERKGRFISTRSEPVSCKFVLQFT